MLQPVVVHQHVDEIFEEVGLAGAEESSRYLIHGLLQLRDTVVVRHSVIAEDKRQSKNIKSLLLLNTSIVQLSLVLVLDVQVISCVCLIPIQAHPFLSIASTSGTLMPKMKRFSSPASSAISTLAPSMVPMVRAPFSMNFMFPVPEASVPAVEICSERSAAGMTANRRQVERYQYQSSIYVL